MNSNELSHMGNLDADLVIIGGGASGLCAAVSAAEAGVSNIVLLEKAKALGGNARVSVGFFAAESQPQKRMGINVTRDEIFQRFMEFNHWKTNAKLVRAWVNKTSELVSWLEKKGVKTMPGEAPFYKGKDSARWHMLEPEAGKPPGMVGKAIVEALAGECEKLGIKVLLEAWANRILMDNEQKVKGVSATTKGREFNVYARSVVISTGGFARNKKMLKKYFPLYNEDMFTHSLPQMTGDGLRMAEQAGAAIDTESMVLVFFGPHHYAWNRHLTYIHRIPEMVHVNKNGERYTNEFTDGSFDCSNALTRQPDGISYTLFDTKIKQDIIEKKRPSGPNMEIFESKDNWLEIIEEDITKELDNGRIKISSSWDEIAEFMGTKPEDLKETIERYNSFCDNGYDAEFLKDKQYLRPLRIPPYYAVLSNQGFDVSSGGIKINHYTEVLDNRNESIVGLYATGNDAGGVHGGTYTGGAEAPGCDLSFALCSGSIAGDNAAAFVLADGK